MMKCACCHGEYEFFEEQVTVRNSGRIEIGYGSRFDSHTFLPRTLEMNNIIRSLLNEYYPSNIIPICDQCIERFHASRQIVEYDGTGDPVYIPGNMRRFEVGSTAVSRFLLTYDDLVHNFDEVRDFLSENSDTDMRYDRSRKMFIFSKDPASGETFELGPEKSLLLTKNFTAVSCALVDERKREGLYYSVAFDNK